MWLPRLSSPERVARMQLVSLQIERRAPEPAVLTAPAAQLAAAVRGSDSCGQGDRAADFEQRTIGCATDRATDLATKYATNRATDRDADGANDGANSAAKDEAADVADAGALKSVQRRIVGWLALGLATLRSALGAPDYQTYVAHRRAHHPGEPVLGATEFFRQRQAAKYRRGSSRCC